MTRFARGVLYTCSFKTSFCQCLIATSIDQQYMYVILPRVKQFAFTQATF